MALSSMPLFLQLSVSVYKGRLTSPTLCDVVASHPSCIAHSLTLAAVSVTETSVLLSHSLVSCALLLQVWGNRKQGQGPGPLTNHLS